MSSQGCDHGVHFFKIILESNIRDGELRVPRSFVMRHWQGISNPVSLRLPNNTEWKVYWMKRDGDVWFGNGWKEFAQYLSLDVSQFVVFRYEENSHFNMIIFDKSALEIKYPSRVTDEKGEEVDESDYSLKILEDCSPFKVKREKSPSPSSRTRKKMKTNPREEQADAAFDKAKHMGGNQTQGLNFDKSKFACAKKELDEDVEGTTKCLKVDLLISKITEVLNKAASFRSKNPSFVVVMKPTYVHRIRGYLHVPSQFAEKYLRKKNILLQVLDGRTWACKHNFGRIYSGWKEFASENNLNVGDVCLFDLTKSRDLSFKVRIFRLAEEPDSPTVQESVEGQGERQW